MGKDNLCGCLSIYIEQVPMDGSYLCNLVISTSSPVTTLEMSPA